MTTPAPDTAANTDDQPTDDDRLMTITAAAAYLACSRSWVEKRIYEDQTLPAVRIGRTAIRVWLSDVRALISPVEL